MRLSKRSELQEPERSELQISNDDLPIKRKLPQGDKKMFEKIRDEAIHDHNPVTRALQSLGEMDAKISQIIEVFTKPDRETMKKTVEWKAKIQALMGKLQKHLDELIIA